MNKDLSEDQLKLIIFIQQQEMEAMRQIKHPLRKLKFKIVLIVASIISIGFIVNFLISIKVIPYNLFTKLVNDMAMGVAFGYLIAETITMCKLIRKNDDNTSYTDLKKNHKLVKNLGVAKLRLYLSLALTPKNQHYELAAIIKHEILKRIQ